MCALMDRCKNEFFLCHRELSFVECPFQIRNAIGEFRLTRDSHDASLFNIR
jgi:hypothetical protein